MSGTVPYTLTLPPDYVPPDLPGRDAWIAALRSGEYKQGENGLYSGGCHCVLGVLVASQGRLRKRPHPLLGDYGCDGDHPEASQACLSGDNPARSVLGAEGIIPDSVMLEEKGAWRLFSLVGANDLTRLSFAALANVIERLWAEPDEAGKD